MECGHFIASANDIRCTLDGTDGYKDIIIHKSTYTFAQQSSYSKNCIVHRRFKLHFRVLGGILYVIRYPRESDWQPNASLENSTE
jgi:hypothetical protein